VPDLTKRGGRICCSYLLKKNSRPAVIARFSSAMFVLKVTLVHVDTFYADDLLIATLVYIRLGIANSSRAPTVGSL